MEVFSTAIPDVRILVPKRFGDHRGFFCETFSKRALEQIGIIGEFVQDNHSLSRQKGVLRGLHFQIAPKAQDKLVRVVRGSILDVAVDIRPDSPTYKSHVSDLLSADNGRQLFVPKGFAHGFVTLEPDTEVVYKVTDYYSPEHERGILWCDPALGIDWTIRPEDAVLSDRDRKHPPLADADLGIGL
jgi:dTDP-4-dehydrorhamnose 3,5-epimerase